jgi:hypothetical protein
VDIGIYNTSQPDLPTTVGIRFSWGEKVHELHGQTAQRAPHDMMAGKPVAASLSDAKWRAEIGSYQGINW